MGLQRASPLPARVLGTHDIMIRRSPPQVYYIYAAYFIIPRKTERRIMPQVIDNFENLRNCRNGALSRFIMERPKALNSLTLEMIRALQILLNEAKDNDDIKAVMIEGEGKAFCAGGDVKSVCAAGKKSREKGEKAALTRDFFFEEYQLNYNIFRFKKPYVAWLDGYTMGGGCGVSAHGNIRIATENTIWAMPETAIGLFPDVGMAFYLARLKGEAGLWLALTGARLYAKELLELGLVTHYMPSTAKEVLVSELEKGEKDIETLLEELSISPPTSQKTPDFEAINRCYSSDSLKEILENLEKENTDWAKTQIKTLRKNSPTSLNLALRHIRDAEMLDMATILKQDFRLSQFCMEGHDFYEGIRAMLIDKDHKPKWSPSKIENINNQDISPAFTFLGDKELDLS